MLRLLALALLLAGCGGARPVASSPPSRTDAAEPECDRLRAEAAAARDALDACRAIAAPTEWAHRETFEWLDEHVGSHLAAVREGEGGAATIAELQEIADRVWALLDAVHGEVSDAALLDRIEDATEGLMRDHDPDGREQALAALGTALGALRAESEPTPPPRCEGEERTSAAAWIGVQATCARPDGSER